LFIKKCAALSDHERRLVIMALAFQLEDLMTAQGMCELAAK
jgi:hypothetical protein